MGPLDIQLSTDELERLGADAATAVRLPPENGGGFYVNLEFQHQLHCVVSSARLSGISHTNLLAKKQNYLRMATYMSYYETKSVEFTDSKQTQRIHLGMSCAGIT